MTATESNAAHLSLELPNTLTTPEIDRMIQDVLGVTFRFLTRVEKRLPRSYTPRHLTPAARLADALEDSGCHIPDAPDCENCRQWHTCATPQEAGE